jgi:ribosomal protein S18 acetylase RimI-like enzyme
MASKKANQLKITPYHLYEYDEVYDFLYNLIQFHVHLEWEALWDWLRDSSTRVIIARDTKGICGVLACTAPHNEASWLRLLAIEPKKLDSVLPPLWAAMLPLVPVKTLVSTVREEWFTPVLESLGFRPLDLIINFTRQRQPIPKYPLTLTRIIEVQDWEHRYILEIDHAAFNPIWQLKEKDLDHAMQHADHFMGAYDDNQMVGYLMAMRHDNNFHLSRLAVYPEYQNRGIGRRLLYDFICKAEQLPADKITLNTQLSNLSSRHLYEKFGFVRDSKGDLRVYIRDLP